MYVCVGGRGGWGRVGVDHGRLCELYCSTLLPRVLCSLRGVLRFLRRRDINGYPATSILTFSSLCGVFVSQPGVPLVAAITQCDTGSPVRHWLSVFSPVFRPHSTGFTRAQGIPTYQIGCGRGKGC